MVVLDASWAIEALDADDAMLDVLSGDEICVPTLFEIECASVAVKMVRRGELDGRAAADLLDRLLAVPDVTAHVVGAAALRTALAERLTAYDAAYLVLALELGAALATRDRALAAAAHRAGVPVLS